MAGDRWRVTRLATATVVVGAVLAASSATAAPRRVEPIAVIALLDSGINPYHVESGRRARSGTRRPTCRASRGPRSPCG